MPKDSSEDFDLIERALLGNILTDDTGELFLTAATQLTEEDFLSSKNREIFNCMISMNNRGVNIDVANVYEELKNLKKIDEIGGYEYLSKIVDSSVTIGGSESYINNIKDRSLLNKFLNSLREITVSADANPITDISEFIGQSESKILQITQQRRVADYLKMDKVSEDLVSKLVLQSAEFRKNGKKPNGVIGLETGYADLDRYTKGWQKGEMIVIGARPSVGKTAFAINLLYQVAKRGIPVLFFSLEMKAVAIARRLLTNTSNLTTDEIDGMDYMAGSTADKLLVSQRSENDIANRTNLQKGLIELKNLPFYIDDNPGSKILDIANKCKKVKNVIQNLGLIVIDYLGLITTSGKSESRQQEVSAISRQLKQLARELDVPLIALSQLSRESDKREVHKPQISDLRDSGAIEQDADMILMLYREDYYKSSMKKGKGDVEEVQQDNDSPFSRVNVNLIKNRNGRTGELYFIFDKEHCMFSPEARDDEVAF